MINFRYNNTFRLQAYSNEVVLLKIIKKPIVKEK